MTSIPDTPTNLALCPKTCAKLRRTSTLEGGYYHGMEQMFVLLNTYAYLLRLCLFMFACIYMFAICLCIFVYTYGLL
jgi:hypothetical protein